jgi:CheY-like chemotaxis protein
MIDHPEKLAAKQLPPLVGGPIVTDSAQQALRLIDPHNIDATLIGLQVSDAARLQILREIKAQSNVEAAIMTTNSAAEPAVEVMRAGASDCLIKPFSLEELRRMLVRIASRLKARPTARQLGEQIKSGSFAGMIGRAPEMEQLYRIVSKASQSSHPVLILGETGTGKELVARAIQSRGAGMMNRWASSEFSTDWGTRDLSPSVSFYDPISYHQGSVWPLFTGWVSLSEYRNGHALSGYSHLMQNADLTWAQDLGAVTELLSGEYFRWFGRSTSHQLWSSAMVVTPTLRGMLGLECSAAEHRLSVTPQLPAQ